MSDPSASEDVRVPDPTKPPLNAEEKARAAAYIVGVLWGVAFLIWTPHFYDGVIDHWSTRLWSISTGAGLLVAAIGQITQRDLKVELPGLYIAIFGDSLYFVAQSGFADTSVFHDRISATVYILFGLLMLLPRLIALEGARQRARKLAREQGLLK